MSEFVALFMLFSRSNRHPHTNRRRILLAPAPIDCPPERLLLRLFDFDWIVTINHVKPVELFADVVDLGGAYLRHSYARYDDLAYAIDCFIDGAENCSLTFALSSNGSK